MICKVVHVYAPVHACARLCVFKPVCLPLFQSVTCKGVSPDDSTHAVVIVGLAAQQFTGELVGGHQLACQLMCLPTDPGINHWLHRGNPQNWHKNWETWGLSWKIIKGIGASYRNPKQHWGIMRQHFVAGRIRACSHKPVVVHHWSGNAQLIG